MKSSSKTALFIINPVAGKRIIRGRLKSISSLFREHDYELDIHYTGYEGEAITLAAECAADKDLVVCCGGDGTLNEVVSGLMSLPDIPPIGYIPAGTTNDFARSLGIKRELWKAAKCILDGTPQSIDIGRFGQNYFLYVASFGAFTQSSYSTPQNMKNVFGHFAYILEGIKEIPAIKPLHMKFTADGGTVYEDDYILGAVCNGTSIGGMIKLNAADVDFADGLFEVLLIKYPQNFAKLTRTVIALKSNNFKDESIRFFHTNRLSIECEDGLMWSLDGQCVKCGQAEEISNIHKAISIILTQEITKKHKSAEKETDLPELEN